MSEGLFGVTATKLSDPRGQGANVVAPTTGNPLGALVEGIGQVASIFDGISKNDAKKKDEATLNEYSTKLNAIANGLSSGSLDQKEANVRSQQLYQNFSGTIAPHLSEELAKRRKAIFEGSSLNEAEQNAKIQRDLKFEALKSFQANGGVIPPGANERDLEVFIKAEAARKLEQDKWTRYRQEQEEKRASGNYSYEQDRRESEKRSIDSLNNIASTQLPAFNTIMDGLIKSVDGGQADWKTANIQRNAVYSSLQLQLKQAAGMNPAIAENWGRLLDESNKVYERLMDPVKRADVSASELKELQSKAALLTWNQSPKAQQSYVLGYFAPNSLEAQVGIKGTAAEISAIWAGTKSDSGENVPAVIGDKENSKPVVQSIQSNMKNVYGMTDGDPKKTKAIEGMSNQVNNLLVDIYKTGTNEFKTITPADLNDAASLISSNEFGKMVQQGLVNGKALNAAQRVLAIQYNQPILNKANETIVSAKDQLKDIDVKFEDGKIVVNGKVDVKLAKSSWVNPNDNFNDLSKAIDRVVKMNANLEGRTDYKEYWEQNRHLLVPTLYQTPGLKVGTQKTYKGATYEYTGGPELSESSWTKIKQ